MTPKSVWKPASGLPSALNRTIAGAATTLPSDCNAIEFRYQNPAPGSKLLSPLPLEFRRPIPEPPLTEMDGPPINTLPSGCTTTQEGEPPTSEPGLKPMSRLPLVLSLAMRSRFVPLTMVKSPPMSTLPSDCTATEFTVLLVSLLELKVLSRLPLA